MKRVIKHKHILALFLVAILAQVNVCAETIVRKVNVVYIGNSITAATYLVTTPPKAAAEYLMDEGYLVKYSNCGMSGYTTVNFLPPGGTFNTVAKAGEVFYKEKDALLVFSIKLGTNDSAIEGTTGAPVSPDNYKKNLKTIADSLYRRFPGCKIVLNRPTWYSPNTHNSAKYLQEGLDRLQTYFPQITALANENPGYIYEGDKDAYAFFEANYLQYFNAQEGNAGTFYLHPNQDGANILGEFWAKALKKLLIQWGYDLDAGRKKVLCVGNSITNNALLNNEDRYPIILQSILGEGYNVKNYGIGNRTMLQKGDYPYIKEQRFTEGLNWNPDIVIIKLGTNDMKNSNWAYKADFVNNYVSFVDSFKLKNPQSEIFICIPTPLFPGNIISVNDSRLVDEMIPMINEVASRTGAKIIDLHSALLNVSYCTYDNLHPNKKGTNIMARVVAKSVYPDCVIPPLSPTLFIQAESANFLADTGHGSATISTGVPASNKDNEDGSGSVIQNVWDGNFAVYNNIDFGSEGFNYLTFRKNIPRGSRIEVWIDRTINTTTKTATEGSLIGVFEVQAQINTDQAANTATPTVWKTLETPLSTTLNGIHNLCLVFRAGSSSKSTQELGMLNWFEFSKNTVKPESIYVASDKITLNIGKSYKVTPAVLPLSASMAVSFEVVERQSVVSVNAGGEIHALGVGAAKVLVKSDEDSVINKLIDVTVGNYELASQTNHIEAETAGYLIDTYHWGGASNVIKAGDLNKGTGETGLINLWHTDVAVFKNVDFGQGATQQIKICRNFPRESFVEIWIDRTVDKSMTPAGVSGGVFVKSLFIGGTDGWTVWKTLSFDMPEIIGVHDLYFTFYSAEATKPNQQHGYIDWFEVNRAVISETSSVDNELDFKIEVYPNPVSDYLNVGFADSKIKKLKIFSGSGKVVYVNRSVNELLTKINVKSYTQGTYFAKIETDRGNKVIKFIKN